MDVAGFKASLAQQRPPRGISAALTGLWWEAKGNWTEAHEAAQRQEGTAGAWVHAYLHRKEGDLENARYWYRRAGKPAATMALAREWETIAEALLKSE
ncbi:MAG TPA: hypothetical protein VGU20_19380 [Stellaceae bacterium]|nr:hypothetical protein [Stellaceae bacterium]